MRELRNVAERYALGLPVFRKTGAAPDSHTAPGLKQWKPSKSLRSATRLNATRQLSQASVALGIAKTTLFDKQRKYGLNQPGETRRPPDGAADASALNSRGYASTRQIPAHNCSKIRSASRNGARSPGGSNVCRASARQIFTA